MEYIEDYYPGGYHPVQIGDTFNGGRFVVVHKLGHGGFSTVWLVEDLSTKTYASLKILAANAGKRSRSPSGVRNELEVLAHLRHATNGNARVPRLIDSFTHTGPNGEHQCIVTELLGPNLGCEFDELYPGEVFPIVISRAIIRDIAYAVQDLHRNNVVHGDLHNGNILLVSPTLSSLRRDDVERYYGEIGTYEIKPGVDGAGMFPHVPPYLVGAPEPVPLLQLCIQNPVDIRVKICDLGEASIVNGDRPPEAKPMNMSLLFSAPEAILLQPLAPKFSVDIWSLGVLFCSVLGGGDMFGPPLLFSGHAEDAVLRIIVRRLGKLPEPMWSAWTKRSEYFDDEGRPLEDTVDRPFLAIADELMGEEERFLFEEMIRAMLVLDPEKRCTIEDVIKSKWFSQYSKGMFT